MKTFANRWLPMIIAALFLVPTLLAGTAAAGVRAGFAYTSGAADVRVWVSHPGDDEYYDDDVYESPEDVVLYFQTARNCYVTVYVVDTDGYLHVVYPYGPGENAYVRGRRVYRVFLGDVGFGVADFDRGVAFAYAVSSPVPFDFRGYGVSVFGPRYGFEIYGDPYVAAKRFYLSLLGSCDRYLIGVSFARFYIREYARYPRYLCVGWHDYYGVRNYCRGDCAVYRHYRVHARDPYRILRPKYRIKSGVAGYTRIAHGARSHERVKVDRYLRGDHRSRERKTRKVHEESNRYGKKQEHYRRRRVTGSPVAAHVAGTAGRKNVRGKVAGKVTPKRPGISRSQRAKVVRSSKERFVRSKRNIVTMRRELKVRGREERGRKLKHRKR